MKNLTITQVQNLVINYINKNADDLKAVDFVDCVHYTDFCTLDDNGEYVTDIDLELVHDSLLNDYIRNYEIIYYSNAIDYLKENDPSLNHSISLLMEQGVESLDTVNSELLATVHAQDSMINDLHELGLASLTLDDLID